MRTADMPMTDAQAKLLKRLCETHGKLFKPEMTREAAKWEINRLIRKEREQGGPPNLAA